MDKQNDQLSENPPRNTGRGQPLLYTRKDNRELAVELLKSYKWHILIALVVLALLIGLGVLRIPTLDDVPPEAWSTLWYMTLGAIPGVPVGVWLYRRWHSVEGIESWDIDPITDDHRHVRLGTEIWDDLVVLSPWGEVVGRGELAKCTINGRPGREMMDLRIKQDGTPVCVATQIGESSTAEIRTYRSALVYTRRILSQKANKAIMQEANREPIAREVAERVVVWMIRQSEVSGVPGGEQIETVVQDVLQDMDLDDPLANDDLRDQPDRWTPRDDDPDGGAGGAQLGDDGDRGGDPLAAGGAGGAAANGSGP